MDEASTCAFCGVVAGRIEASVLYEDPDTVAFVDLRQPGWPRGGHVLVVPKTHVEFLYDLPDDLAARMMQTAVRVARAVQQVAEPGGISLWSSNGAAADQEVPHVHLHVLARHADDGLLRVYRDRPERPQRASLLRRYAQPYWMGYPPTARADTAAPVRHAATLNRSPPGVVPSTLGDPLACSVRRSLSVPRAEDSWFAYAAGMIRAVVFDLGGSLEIGDLIDRGLRYAQ